MLMRWACPHSLDFTVLVVSCCYPGFAETAEPGHARPGMGGRRRRVGHHSIAAEAYIHRCLQGTKSMFRVS